MKCPKCGNQKSIKWYANANGETGNVTMHFFKCCGITQADDSLAADSVYVLMGKVEGGHEYHVFRGVFDHFRDAVRAAVELDNINIEIWAQSKNDSYIDPGQAWYHRLLPRGPSYHQYFEE